MNAGFGEGTDPDRDAVNAAIHARQQNDACPFCKGEGERVDPCDRDAGLQTCNVCDGTGRKD